MRLSIDFLLSSSTDEELLVLLTELRLESAMMSTKSILGVSKVQKFLCSFEVCRGRKMLTMDLSLCYQFPVCFLDSHSLLLPRYSATAFLLPQDYRN